MEGFFYKGIWRMDWGLGNPNKTAALIAMLMVAVWGLAMIRKWGFWVALALFTGLGVCLIHTFSRGGLIAAFAGLAAAAWKSPRPWPWPKVVAVAVSIWVMIGFSISLDAHERYGQGLVREDRSISNRFEIWKAAPRMMVDAPRGWGLGNAGQAYMQWYQPLHRSEEYRTLVNSHFTWLVEFGWPLRFLYILGWLTVLFLCFPASSVEHRASSVDQSLALGVWVAFAVAALFSSVAESPWLWIVPGIGLLAVLINRIKGRGWPRPVMWLLPPGATAFLMGALFVSGRGHGDLRGSPDGVILGQGEAQIVLVADGNVLGKNYGKKLREFLQSEGRNTVAIVKSVNSLGDMSGKIVVLSGNLTGQDKVRVQAVLTTAKKVVFVNPSFPPSEWNLSKESVSKMEAVFGEFSLSPAKDVWAEAAAVRRIEGAGDFLPQWPEVLLVSHPKK